MGANLAGQDDLFEEISQGKINFDVLLTTPLLVPKLGKLGKILGPKSLMPSLKSGTVTQNLKETIEEFKKGKLEYRADKNGIVHITFGKTSFSEEQLLANLVTLYNSIEKNKPAGVKGKYFHSFYICTTMSPSVKIDLPSFKTIL
jgi:large subunit ribosomal protein L1